MRKRMKPKFHPLSDYQPKFKIMINFFSVCFEACRYCRHVSWGVIGSMSAFALSYATSTYFTPFW